MKTAGLVLTGKGPDGAVLYALSERGAQCLRNVGVAASTGKDLVRTFSAAHYHHRCVANQCAVSAIQEGYRAAPEREIAQGRWFGGDAGVAGKCPDVLLRNNQDHWWVEVERSRKNARDYSRLLAWLRTAIPEVLRGSASPLLGEPRRLAGIIFVCRPSFETRLKADLLAQGLVANDIEMSIRFETCLYSLEAIAFY